MVRKPGAGGVCRPSKCEPKLPIRHFGYGTLVHDVALLSYESGS